MSEPPPQPGIPTDPGLTEMEAALGSLSPMPNRLDRDRLMYLAGRAAPRAPAISRLAWPAIAAGFALVAIGEAALLIHRPDPDPRAVGRLVDLPAPQTPTPPDRPAEAPPEELAASTSGAPDPVVILHRSTPEPRSSIAPGASDVSPAGLRLRLLRLGLDALPEPPPLPVAMNPGGAVADPAARSSRSELEHLLIPGEPS